jgi:hypothetical protein
MGAINAVSHVNATLGLAAAAAILGQDTVKGMLGLKDADLASVGVPSEAALLAAERLAREQEAREAARRDAAPSGGGPVAESEVETVAPVSDPWADLPEARQPDPWADLPAPDPWADLPATEPPPDRQAADPWADLPAG